MYQAYLQARKVLFPRKYAPQRGFTLIQLLVSIIIIGIIGSIVFSSASSSRIKGRDSKRLSDLNQMKVALEFYREAEGHYPYTCDSAIQPFGLTSFDSVSYKNQKLCTAPNGNTMTTLTLTQAMAPYIKGDLSDPKRTIDGSGYLYENQYPTNIYPTPGYCFKMWKTPENLGNFPANTLNPARCGSIDASGQCSSAGWYGLNAMGSSVYIGKGYYADPAHAGC